MTKPRRNFIPMPFYPLTVKATPEERMFILALYHHDWDGVLAWPSQGRIATIMGCSKDTVARTQAKLISRGWLVVEKDKGRSNSYSVNIPDMTMDEFNAYLSTQPHLAPTPLLNHPQDAVTPPSKLRQPIPQAEAPLNNRAIEAELKTRTTSGKHPDQDAFWKFAQPTFKAITGQTLSWPRTPTFQKQITEGLTQHGSIELCRRWDNYLVDPYAQSRSLLGFFYDLDKWITRREKLTGGNNATRAFHQPKTDWKPSGNRAPAQDQ